jgi:hypothetical protein
MNDFVDGYKYFEMSIGGIGLYDGKKYIDDRFYYSYNIKRFTILI